MALKKANMIRKGIEYKWANISYYRDVKLLTTADSEGKPHILMDRQTASEN